MNLNQELKIIQNCKHLVILSKVYIYAYDKNVFIYNT